MSRLSIASALLFLAPATATAQSAWTVDSVHPGADFTDIQSAVDAAAPGDLILVKPGLYSEFTMSGKGVDVVADGNPVRVIGPIVIEDLPGDEAATLRGLKVPYSTSAVPFASALEVSNCVGPVWVEDLRTNFATPPTPFTHVNSGVYVTSCASVLFIRCTLRGGFESLAGVTEEALLVANSTASIYGSDLTGGNAGKDDTIFNYDGATGLYAFNSTVSSFDSTIRGGDGLDGIPSAIFCQSCAGGDGGTGLESDGSSVLVQAGAIFAGNAGAGSSCAISCVAGDPGVRTAVTNGGTATEVVTPTARSMRTTSPVRENALVSSTLIGVPGDAMVLVSSPVQVPVVTLPNVVGTPAVGTPFSTFFLGQMGPTGQKISSGVLPDLGPGFDFVSFYLQTVFLGTDGTLTAGAPSVLHVVDDGI